ncbi:MAG: glycosyltransferase family 9 protein [Planctomycetaceae bacterium]|nr:glycosyltransferase family 9 protein [Planctomycetaceae bacterium]
MNSILISNLNNLGDVICSTAALDLIRRHFPYARIGVLVKPDAAEVLRRHPLIDYLHVYQYKSGSSIGSLWNMSWQVRDKAYEMYISLDRKPRSALIAFLAGIKTRITPDCLHLTTQGRWWMPYLCNRVLHFPPNSFHSLVDMFEEPVRQALGIDGKGETSIGPFGDTDKERARNILALSGDKKVIGFSVRANAAVKNWPPERFATVMDRLAVSLDPFLYVTGAPGDREYVEALLEQCRYASPVNLCGYLTLMEMAALTSKSDLFITLDTGAVHVAGNSGVKRLICIFTATEPEGVLESAKQATVLCTNEPCCPCTDCPHDESARPCQLGISVDTVFKTAVDLLAKD